MSTITLLLASFGGGVFGALIGPLAAFIFTGITALIGIAIVLSGGGDAFLNEVAFGAFFGPHIAFAGGVAALAYAGRKTLNRRKKVEDEGNLSGAQVALAADESFNAAEDVENGADVTVPMFKTNDSVVLLVGGVFGMLGFLINQLYASVLSLPLDTVALAVFTSGLIVRFTFGKAGLMGVFPENEGRFNFTGKGLMFNALWAGSVGAVVGYVVMLTEVGSLGFAISATTLIFAYFGLSFPTSHHVTMVAGIAALTFGNIWMAILFAVLAVISGDFMQRYTNTYVDTHLDMPATIIALWTFVLMGIFS